MQVEVMPIETLVLSIVVLLLGTKLNDAIAWLREHLIPPAVTGGIVFSAIVAVIYAVSDVEVTFDMRIRDLLLLVFFSTIGLSAKLSTLRAGGVALAKLVGAAAVFLVLQDAAGIGIAVALGERPGYGLMAGSVSLAGGHGTAIAWGAEAEAVGLKNASAIGLAFATFGLVAGGIIGGPIASRLIRSNGLEAPQAPPDELESAPDERQRSTGIRPRPVLTTLFVLGICVEFGSFVNESLSEAGVVLPGFLTSMFVGIVITNVSDAVGIKLPSETFDNFGNVSLSLFLSMSLMDMQLWSLAEAAQLIVTALFVQILVMNVFAMLVVFRAMGRDYDAAVITAGFAGLGLGATPVALANMSAVTDRYGPSPKAYLVVPLVGAFFIDLLNAVTIKFFIGALTRWVG
ncbi:MAG: sodium/glutamate symporter [Myxococcota bacterium]